MRWKLYFYLVFTPGQFTGSLDVLGDRAISQPPEGSSEGGQHCWTGHTGHEELGKLTEASLGGHFYIL